MATELTLAALAKEAWREERARLRTLLRATMFLPVFAMATSAWASNSTSGRAPVDDPARRDVQADPAIVLVADGERTAPPSELRSPALNRFLKYLKMAHGSDYRAFAVDLESGKWGMGESPSQPNIAVRKSLEDCRKRRARDCRSYAVGDIVVHGLADRRAEVAIILYQVKRGATNDDLATLVAEDGGAAIMALRRAVFYTAAIGGSPETVAAMLERGINVDARSDAGVTALLYAASRGRAEVVALLLKRGADVDARNGVGKTALAMALHALSFVQPRDYRTAEHEAVIRLLKDAGARE